MFLGLLNQGGGAGEYAVRAWQVGYGYGILINKN